MVRWDSDLQPSAPPGVWTPPHAPWLRWGGVLTSDLWSSFFLPKYDSLKIQSSWFHEADTGWFSVLVMMRAPPHEGCDEQTPFHDWGGLICWVKSNPLFITLSFSTFKNKHKIILCFKTSGSHLCSWADLRWSETLNADLLANRLQYRSVVHHASCWFDHQGH